MNRELTVSGALPASFDYASIPDESARALQATVARVRGLSRMITANALEIGRELIRAKAALDHGQFGPWLAAEFDMSDRTAQRCIRAAEFVGDKSDTVADLQPTTIYLLAAPSTPEQAKKNVIERLEKGERISDDAIIQLVRKAKTNAKKAPPKLSPGALEKREQQRQENARKRAATRAATDVLVEWLRQHLGEDVGMFVEIIAPAGTARLQSIGKRLAEGMT